MNELFIVTGNKGGIGKSFLSCLLTDYILRTEPEKLVVCDSEAANANGQATFWNILKKDKRINEIFKWKLNVEKGYQKMGEAIEEMQDKKIIIDTGASMLAMLRANINFITSLQNETNSKIKIIFVIGALPDSTIAARQYIKTISELEDNKIETHFVMISPTENEPEDFNFHEEKDIKEAIEELIERKHVIKTHFIGSIRQDFFNYTMNDFFLPSAILEDLTRSFSSRTMYSMWLKGASDNVIGAIIKS